MGINLSADVRARLSPSFAILETPYEWRRVTSRFKDEVPPREQTSHVHVVPFIGDRAVLLRTEEDGWSTPGGTLLEGEAFDAAVTRELAEAIGGRTDHYELFGQWDSSTTDRTAYQPWLPHPRFALAVGWADVVISGPPESRGGVEVKNVLEIVVLPVERAAERLVAGDRPHLAALYSLAHEVRRASRP
ncbi:NUDIX domain-containing protein [Streptomyces sp. DvalAA-14]|uniref:NUDIX domain-containing protein n=1 Tax=unclassified Streptomyces TaxID=2593676 RepID=UPI00081AEB6A|nr:MULTISPECIES: NUDIX domain-containing protein [unclassified Streptomyces]MYS21427.1 NUDIX domain-containing protein [Streptomyces sp. SID4948]SCD92461.1 NUDIX domain-containing protein [Streptomyces sp. DvalAA-14]